MGKVSEKSGTGRFLTSFIGGMVALLSISYILEKSPLTFAVLCFFIGVFGFVYGIWFYK
jgi:uncharacterized membrane protein YgaE (UPF0421/DUF939 family)